MTESRVCGQAQGGPPALSACPDAWSPLARVGGGQPPGVTAWPPGSAHVPLRVRQAPGLTPQGDLTCWVLGFQPQTWVPASDSSSLLTRGEKTSGWCSGRLRARPAVPFGSHLARRGPLASGRHLPGYYPHILFSVLSELRRATRAVWPAHGHVCTRALALLLWPSGP